MNCIHTYSLSPWPFFPGKKGTKQNERETNDRAFLVLQFLGNRNRGGQFDRRDGQDNKNNRNFNWRNDGDGRGSGGRSNGSSNSR